MSKGLREWLEDERNEGFAEGVAKGKAEMLVGSVEAVMWKFKISLGEACETIGATEEEYLEAKKYQ